MFTDTDLSGKTYAGHDTRGSYTIETMLSLFVFMAAFLAIVSYISILQTETRVQHALDMAASAVAGYCYPADRVLDIGESGGTVTEDAVSAFSSFISVFSGSENSGGNAADNISEKISAIKSGYSSLKNAADTISESLGDEKDLSAVLSLIAGTVAKDTLRSAAGRVAGMTLAGIIVPEYIGDGRLYGIDGGIDGIDFSLSSILSDGRTVRIVAVYKITLPGFGIADISYTVCQSAVTHAWLCEKDDVTCENVVEIWQHTPIARGKEFVKLYKEEFPYRAVAAGAGVDIYNRSTETVTSVVSINVFCKTYSVYTPPENGETADCGNYSINIKAVTGELLQRAEKLSVSCEKLQGKTIKMENGAVYTCAENMQCVLKTVLPYEANNKAWNMIFSEIADKIEKETGVRIEYEYRYHALE